MIDASFATALRRARPAKQSYVSERHPKQKAFVQDYRPRIAMLGGRRGGKSHGLARRLLKAGERHKNSTSVYVTLTRGKARQILWNDCLLPLNEELGLGLRLTTQDNLLYLYQPNGSRIWLVGVDDQREVEKIRGGKYSEVVIDEAMAMPDFLRELVLDSTLPALMDLRGSCVLAGTPSAMMAGYFYEATTGANPKVAQWPTHQFTMLDNPFVPEPEQYLKEVLERDYGGNPDHPSFRREYLGEWVEDIGALVYPFTYEANSWQPEGEHPYGLPHGEYSYGLGIDLGYGENSTGFVLAAKRKDAGQVYILKAYTESRWDPIKVAAHVKRWRARIEQQTGCGLRVVVDEGALGRGYTDLMRNMGIGCEGAVKAEKRSYQDYVQGLILGRSVKVHYAECKPLIDEARKLQFDAETGKEDDRYVNHACDAFLYITRAFFPTFKPKEWVPEPGSPAALSREMKAERQARIDERERKQRVF